MKIRLMIYTMAACLVIGGFSACSSDDLGNVSVITTDKNVSNTPFDQWLVANFQTPYNVAIDWRWEENEVILGNYTVPADYTSAIMLAHIIKHCCMEAYDEAVSVNFTRRNFPKQLVFVGSWQYNNNNSRTLGTAEGGRKIWLLGVNDVALDVHSVAKLNRDYLKTIHHEFQHIMNQTTPYSIAYKEITKTTYIADAWSTSPNNVGYLQRGYISDYAQKNDKEDFAEMYSIYVTTTEEQWQELLDGAAIDTEDIQLDNSGNPVYKLDDNGNKIPKKDSRGNVVYKTDENGDVLHLLNPETGKYEPAIDYEVEMVKDYTYRDILLKKLDIVRDYMLKTWGLDIDVMRKVLHRRTMDIVNDRVDLTDVTVNNL